MRDILINYITDLINKNYSLNINNLILEVPENISFGDFALPCFQFSKILKKSPNIISLDIKSIIDNEKKDFIDEVNNLGPYLNFKINKEFFFKNLFEEISNKKENYGRKKSNGKSVMIEFSSPNTNKPQHLGHIRTNLLGDSISNIFEANGYKAIRVNLLNDRGIHICKAMVAWLKFGNGEEPSENLKGDYLVGKYYVLFEKEAKKEKDEFLSKHLYENIFILDAKKFESKKNYLKNKAYAIFGKNEVTKSDCLKRKDFKYLHDIFNKVKENFSEKDLILIDLNSFEKYEKEKFIDEEVMENSKILQEAREMLAKWEEGDKEVIEVWKKLNSWVIEGFNKTYESLGIKFDKYYYESETYKLGKKYVEEGLKKGICYKKDDGSVWIKLPEKEFGGDKLLLRKDGTSVYMTQDIGTSFLKYQDFKMDKSIYVVGSEQDYHFKVLFKILELLGLENAKECYHLSYGMISLPEGRMKSREGKIVEADDLIKEMQEKAKEEILLRGREFNNEELENISKTVGLGALKYYILQFSPRTEFIFDPKASIDFNGKTGPYLQYTHARICTLLNTLNIELKDIDFKLLNTESDYKLLRLLEQYPYIVEKALLQYNTSYITEYIYNLASEFNSFYSKNDNRIKEMEYEQKKAKLALCYMVKIIIKNSLSLLGIQAPEKM
ncbi:MAG: hypothetical protein KatS3mg068_0760 [Candidatus Sericytochromatia bacterium]|nr:MAG: hypothetical protein KatS3mg068_0760 [Candidatus Sericytochromatia bacterium]